MKNRSYTLFLEDMVVSMAKIEEYIIGKSFEDFERDSKTIDAVIRNFEIIGEASKKIPNEVKTSYPLIPWDEMYWLRNKISHEYFGVDLEIIWDIATNYLPQNRQEILLVIREHQ